VKELGYYEENEKLRVEMDLKNKEIQRLRNQTEELQAKYKDLLIKYEEQSGEELNTRIITWSCKRSTRASIRM
jgi:archaellum component FlaC